MTKYSKIVQSEVTATFFWLSFKSEKISINACRKSIIIHIFHEKKSLSREPKCSDPDAAKDEYRFENRTAHKPN